MRTDGQVYIDIYREPLARSLKLHLSIYRDTSHNSYNIRGRGEFPVPADHHFPSLTSPFTLISALCCCLVATFFFFSPLYCLFFPRIRSQRYCLECFFAVRAIVRDLFFLRIFGGIYIGWLERVSMRRYSWILGYISSRGTVYYVYGIYTADLFSRAQRVYYNNVWIKLLNPKVRDNLSSETRRQLQLRSTYIYTNNNSAYYIDFCSVQRRVDAYIYIRSRANYTVDAQYTALFRFPTKSSRGS